MGFSVKLRPMFLNFFIVGMGGAIGSMFRYGVGMICTKHIAGLFPWATFGMNILGSLLIAIMMGVIAHFQNWSEETRLFAVVGILGGFTTFSAFSYDSVTMIERGEYLHAAFYVVGSVLLSIAATFIGLILVRTFAG